MFNAKEMSDYAFSLAYNLFNDKKMWDYAYYYLFGLACYYWHDHWLPLLKEVPNMIRGVPTKIAELKDELESIEDFISNADRIADAVEDKKIKAKIKQLIEASFHAEDVIDEYMIHKEKQLACIGFAAGGAKLIKTCWYWICWCWYLIKTKILRLQIATNTISFQNLRKDPFEIHEADVVGFEEQQLARIGFAARIAYFIKARIGFAARIAYFIKTCWYWICWWWCYFFLRLKIAYKIQNIKSQISEIKDTSVKDHGLKIQSSLDTTSSSSTTITVAFQNLRNAPFHIHEADVVGFEKPRDKLIHWLIEGGNNLTSICVVGMGGQGKTTLVKQVFDKVIRDFPCRVWITLSPSHNGEALLRDMLHEFYKQDGKHPDQSFRKMNRESLVDEVKNYLQGKRYVFVFDDVWNLDIWAEIKFAMIDNKNGSKILITTRNEKVEKAFREDSFTEVWKLKGLNKEQSLKLFNKKAFHDLSECCPENLIDISSEIVEKCNGLPLAIVVIGGILSRKDRNRTQWFNFSKNTNLVLKNDRIIREILRLSYHDLPYNLKSCFLYFGLYPEDYIVCSNTLTRQWIAEGFVKEELGKTLEDVAEGFLEELIHRSLVQVVSISIDERVESCRVHDLVHAMILEKHEDLLFCKNITEDKHLSLTGMIRRLSTTPSSDNIMEGIESSHVRSLLVLEPNTLLKSFVSRIPTTYKRLKVLALRYAESLEVPDDLESLNHLKYFGFCVSANIDSEFPKSIGFLVNLETLDLRSTRLRFFGNYNMPKEICKLRKLRHFLGYGMSLIQLKDGIGGMTSLQTLNEVYLDDGEDEIDNRVLELIEELGNLDQLRELGLGGVRSKYMSAISSSINKMQQLEKLEIRGVQNDTLIDMDLNSPPPRLQHVKLFGYLNKFPEWISKLQNLVKLDLSRLKEGNDAMKLLQSMPNLLSLAFCGGNYEDKLESLHFKEGWFKNLKELCLGNFNELNHILIDEGALGFLKKLSLFAIPELRTLPTGIQHLDKLEVLCLDWMSREFKQSISPDEGKEHWIFKQVPSVEIYPKW